ncbi:MAG: hypothetical protein MZU79_02765 [Anaerotruncus sp.]|nr:hypothetical protein [Anaerotruncus sp.]
MAGSDEDVGDHVVALGIVLFHVVFALARRTGIDDAGRVDEQGSKDRRRKIQAKIRQLLIAYR